MNLIIKPDGGDAYIVINKASGETVEVQRFIRADAQLKAICTCGGVRDTRAPLSFCDHIVGVDIYVEQVNGNAENAASLARCYGLKVNKPEKKPCSVQVIKRCAAIAGEHGLNFSKKYKQGRRAAATLALGEFVETCENLNEEQWVKFADEIKHWGLRWDATSAWHDTSAARGAR